MARNFSNGFDEWGGYMEAKITKLDEQFSAASDPFRKSNLFAGISIFVNGRTDPSADELKRIMMVHGGIFHHYERSHTTYIIASNLPDVKVRNMNTSKIISPQWVVDCVREKRILDYTNYLLYTNQRTTQPSLNAIVAKAKIKETDFSLKLEQESNNGILKKESSDVSGIMRSSEQNCSEIEAEIKSSNQSTVIQKIQETVSEKTNSRIARTAVDPNFLSDFYNNSRLHHIATLGAGFREYLNELRRKHGYAKFPHRTKMREKLITKGFKNTNMRLNTCVMHIDMDCFFVSVGLRKYPQYRGQPVAVTHSKAGAKAVEVHPDADRQTEMELFAKRFEQRLHDNILSDKVRQGFDGKMSLSEIASCSYEAREKGIRNGMFVGQAMQLCPELKTIPYDFEGYRDVAFTLYDTIAQYTLNIEAVSCDEMFVDLSEVLTEIEVTPMAFVEAIREEVREKTGCPCSAGVGRNKLQARMATKRAKPNGQYHLLEVDVEAYMTDVSINELPGVGSSTAHILQENNFLTCGDLQKISMAKLQALVGKKLGETLHQFCRGIDNRPLVYGQIRKSVSAEVNYGIRFSEYAELEKFLKQLCSEVHARLTDIKRKTKCVTLKVMVRAKGAPLEASKFMGHGVCDYITKSVSLSQYTGDLELITRTVLTTMKALDIPPNELRGIGIQLTKLDDPYEYKERKENVIKNMFGKIVEKQKDKEKPIQCVQNDGDVTLEQTSVFQKEVTKTISIEIENDTKQPLTKQSNKRSRSKTTSSSSISAPHQPKTSVRDNDILRMFQNAAPRKNGPSIATAVFSQCPSDVDPTVFAELPEEIRGEILRDCANKNKEYEERGYFELNDSDLGPSTSKAAQTRAERQANEITNADKVTIDPEFLQALPSDIRAEVEMQIKQEQLKALDATRKINKISNESPTSPRDILFAKTKEVDTIRNISVDNIFAQSKCIELLLEWVQSSDDPKQYDIYLICMHAQEFVRNKLIDKLYDPLMYLCRLINFQKSDTDEHCAWHSAYKQIIEAVQLEMRASYGGRKLFLGAQLNCDKCCSFKKTS